MTNSKMLEVYYHGQLVGYLAETPNHLIAFQYSDTWIRNGFPKRKKRTETNGFFRSHFTVRNCLRHTAKRLLMIS